jgi:hypothetical protein
MQKFSQNPVLVALIAGQAGHDLEAMEDGKIVEEVTGILHRIYKNDLALKPTGHIITRWKSDRHARGTYSYIAQGSSGNDYDVLAKPLDNKIFFAGEATNKFQPATVAGALHSGLREAQRIHRYAYINLHKLGFKRKYSQLFIRGIDSSHPLPLLLVHRLLYHTPPTVPRRKSNVSVVCVDLSTLSHKSSPRDTTNASA